MALICPDADQNWNTNGGIWLEKQILQLLGDSLPEPFVVFHSLDWSSQFPSGERHGELDIVVMSPAGDLVVCEVKAGDVFERDGLLYKLYSKKEKCVSKQCQSQYIALKSRLNEAGLTQVQVKHFLVIPMMQVGNGCSLALPNSAIIDSTKYDQLVQLIKDALPNRVENNQAEHVRRILCNLFELQPDLSAKAKHYATATRVMADGLATWVPRINAKSGIYHVQATAGSGKTQLALKLLTELPTNQRALYVCYNRALADHLIQLAPPRCRVMTFHELCVDEWRLSNGEPDFTAKSFFQSAEEHYLSLARSPIYDLMVLDEAQDFDPVWVEALFQLLKEEGRLYILEDDNQRIYSREAFSLPDAVNIVSNETFRTPKAICNLINHLELISPPLVCKSLINSDFPDIYTYDSIKNLNAETYRAIHDLMKSGFQIDDIVILSFHGHQKSELLKSETIGEWTTRRFTGFDKAGNTCWSEGDVLLDSLFRYKGQSAPAIILTEIDFLELNEKVKRQLFVGFTRASAALRIVMASVTASLLYNDLGIV